MMKRKVSHKGVRGKGHAGEREICAILTKQLNLEEPLSRNIDQVKYGGADIVGLEPFAIEVKRQEQQALNTWWVQARSQVTKRNPIPVLIYRKNHQPWRVVMACRDVFKKKHKVTKADYITMEFQTFVQVAKSIL
jgi:hypothetical protein